MNVKNLEKDKIYENYKKTIAKAITKAVKLVRNLPSSGEVEIFMDTKNGKVFVGKMITDNSSNSNENLLSIVKVTDWNENLEDDEDAEYDTTYFDAEMREIEVEEEIDENNVLGDYLYPPEKPQTKDEITEQIEELLVNLKQTQINQIESIQSDIEMPGDIQKVDLLKLKRDIQEKLENPNNLVIDNPNIIILNKK